MKKKGIGLLDASIIGLYGSEIKKYPTECHRIIRVSWDNHTKDVVKEAQPKHIIVIGKNVEKILRFESQKNTLFSHSFYIWIQICSPFLRKECTSIFTAKEPSENSAQKKLANSSGSQENE